jgi:hypothetical protein
MTHNEHLAEKLDFLPKQLLLVLAVVVQYFAETLESDMTNYYKVQSSLVEMF